MTTTSNTPAPADQDDMRSEQRPDGMKIDGLSHASITSKDHIATPLDHAVDIFTHAPVSLWEEDFSEVKRRFDQLKANGVDDLRKHFKKHPEEVLSLARMVRISQVNEETLKLYEAEGAVEFRKGLSLVFNKDSYEIFKDEVIAFWKGRTTFASEAINVTLTGTSKNILIRANIPPGYEHTWARVFVAITDITAIKDSMAGFAASAQKYHVVFDSIQTAIVLADATSGMIVEANKSAIRLFGIPNSDLMGMHLTDLVPGEEQDKVHMLLRNHVEKPGTIGLALNVRHKSKGTVAVYADANSVEINDEIVVVASFTHANETLPPKPAGRESGGPSTGLGKKLTQRECEILGLICSGKTSKMIAQYLSISEKTVETHRARIMQKLETHCVVDLVKFAIVNGLARLK